MHASPSPEASSTPWCTTPVSLPAARSRTCPDAELRRVIETNFFGVLTLTRALLPTFRKQRSGRIVVMSSEAAFNGHPCNSIYVASKWAVEGWAELLAFEVSQFGIDVLLVEPGPYITDIWQTTPRIAPSGSAYRRWSENVFRAGDAHVAAKGGDPQVVAVRVADVIEARSPALPQPGRPPGPILPLRTRKNSQSLATPRR